MISWREAIRVAMIRAGESEVDLVATTLTAEEWDLRFDDDFGAEEGRPFTLWTKKRVYFPACYDGSEWVESVPRDPSDEKTCHLGGG